jgi:hypothetical protein
VPFGAVAIGESPRGAADGEGVGVVINVHVCTQCALFEVGGTAGLAGLFPRLAQGRQQHGGENGDDGNDDKQFNEGETYDPGHDLFPYVYLVG